MWVQVPLCAPHAPLAQLEEHLTFNQGVVGSIPTGRTTYLVQVAQLAERQIVALVVGGSNPPLRPMEP